MQTMLRQIVIACYLIATTLGCFAETSEQKDHLFKITLPEGWRWNEQAGKIRISDPKNGNSISIQFAPSRKLSSDEEKELLKKGNQEFIKRIVMPAKGTVIREEERQISGIHARQLTYLLSHGGAVGNVTYIALFNKGYAFTITFGGPEKNQVEAMKKSVETLKFN
ncbi:MAG: hypothetical protein U1F83_14105 [Verrucomicrobiota bacterium]